ncbi:MAG TPA: hypothetical protein VHQ64_15155 [Pyrinomonadaceae bacterium]|jgi:hypothetical protein|nr:hypothetical protein [Pyrinomonadaceae bacterium]
MFNFADTGGLFEHYEVNRDPFWRKISWLVAGSGAWHLFLVALVLLIPPVRDAFSITAMFRDAGFVDKPYVHTDIDDADIIDFSNQKFHYPEGYWAMDQQGLPPLPEYPVMPFSPTRYAATPRPDVSPSPSLTPSPSPTPLPLIAGNNRGGKSNGKNTDPKAAATGTPPDKSVDQAQKDLEAASKKTGIELPAENEINKAPFKALAMYATDLRDGGKLDFNKAFEITIETTLDSNGKLVKPTVTQKSGDEVLIDLGKELVSAMNDSGVLSYLKKINEDKPNTKVIFTIKQDGADVSATVDSEVSSPDSANKLARGFGILLLAGTASRKGHDEEILLKNTKVSAEGSKVIFKLSMPHEEVVKIVQKGMEINPSPTPLH